MRAMKRAGAARQDRPGRARLWGKRVRRLARPAALVLLSAGAVAAGAAALAHVRPAEWLAGIAHDVAGTALAVREVRIEGRAGTPEPLLRAALGVRVGDPILEFSPSAARARIETLGWIESAAVERRLPGTVLVRLTERRPFAIWQNQGRFAVIDRAGVVIAEQDIHRFGPLPLVVGQGAPAAAAALLDAVNAQPALAERMEAAVRVSERRWNLRLKSGAEIMLPEGTEPGAIVRLAELHAQQALLDRPLAAVDMRLPDRLVVRPAGAEAPRPAARRPS
jgi:cell division protein FtsQ